MNERFEIQGRRRHRRDGEPVRDESRLAHTERLDDALIAASMWVDEGFSVWVYRVDRSDGIRPTYHSVHTSRPQPSTSSTSIRRLRDPGNRAFRRVA